MNTTTLSTYVALTTMARQLPGRLGKHRHPSCLHRWRLHGINGVRLQCDRIGAVWYTTWEWVQAFLRDSKPKARPRLPYRTPLQAKRAYERACTELDEMGIS